MAINDFAFDPVNGFRSTSAYPEPTSTNEIRDQIQDGLDQIRDFINDDLINGLASTTDGSSGADQIGVTEVFSGSGVTVQETLEALKTEIDNAALGAIPNGSITEEKLNSDLANKINRSYDNQPIMLEMILLNQMTLNTGYASNPNCITDALTDLTGLNKNASSGLKFNRTSGYLSLATSEVGYVEDTNSGSASDNYALTEGMKLAQSFRLTSTTTVSKIRIKTGTAHTGSCNVAVRIETNSGGFPSGTLAGTNALKASTTLSASSTVYEITLDASYTALIEETYWIVLTFSSVTGTCQTRGNFPSSIYAYGEAKLWSGSAWGSAIGDLYFQVYQDTAAASTGTAIWTAVTTDGTIEEAIVEASYTNGTGGNTFYISRDGGTTYTTLTTGTLTDITSQPSGTSLVLKWVGTGTATLLGVAWGGLV